MPIQIQTKTHHVPATRPRTWVETIYITEDGGEFPTESLALKRQDELEWEKKVAVIKKIWSGVDLPNRWHYASNAEELSVIKRLAGFGTNKSVAVNDVPVAIGDLDTVLRVGDWIGWMNDDRNMAGELCAVYTYEYVKERLLELMDEMGKMP